jgi:3-isopropylmalate dehydratase small subunit
MRFPLNKFIPYTARFAVLPMENVDTDQIIPARFLKTTDKVGLGDNLFSDWRYDSNGEPKPEFLLNQPLPKGSKYLWQVPTLDVARHVSMRHGHCKVLASKRC